jgi:predicted amidohydrolase YtcJ
LAGESQLYLGGEIHTLEESAPCARAVAVQGGRIAAVGEERECRAALGGDATEIDLQGRVLGFTDTHLHPIMMAYFEMHADLSDDLDAALQACCARRRRRAPELRGPALRRRGAGIHASSARPDGGCRDRSILIRNTTATW